MNDSRFRAALSNIILFGLAIMSLRPVNAAPPALMEARHPVRIERNVLIPTRDGTRLAADIIRPDADGRFPAIIEYIPYRKDDLARSGFDAHTYFAERGFIGVRLDVRGTGGSEGVNTDEYMPVEQQDGFDAVEWCARQPWSNGAVGMFGTSYGGFTCIQVAMHRPPHLKAIVPMYYLADDQRTDEAYSLVYTTAPLDEDVQVLGWPRVILFGSSSATVATFVAKLADVAPDGSSALIVDGSLNVTRRNSLTEPEPAEPGKVYELEIPMNPTGWVIGKGHRLRLAVSGADFPNLWPTPERARQRVYRSDTHASRVILPIVPAAKFVAPQFHPPPSLPPILKSYGKPPHQQVLHDQITGTITVINETGSTITLPGNMGTLTGIHNFRCTASSRDPAQSSIVGTHTNILEREDGDIEVTAESTIRATD